MNSLFHLMGSELYQQNIQRVNRRQLFGRLSNGLGVTALASLLGSSATVHAVLLLPL